MFCMVAVDSLKLLTRAAASKASGAQLQAKRNKVTTAEPLRTEIPLPALIKEAIFTYGQRPLTLCTLHDQELLPRHSIPRTRRGFHRQLQRFFIRASLAILTAGLLRKYYHAHAHAVIRRLPFLVDRIFASSPAILHSRLRLVWVDVARD